MPSSFSPEAAARWIAEQHAGRHTYANLPDALAPSTIAEAYAAQEALHRLLEPRLGPIAGLKIATTTKVMQALMGIDHPCGGGIFERTIHTSPATLDHRQFVNLNVEFELAVRLVIDLPKGASPWTRDTVRPAISTVMPAFELIEDRNAVYRETRATSLIADNAWNGGIVLGRPTTNPVGDLDGIEGRLIRNGEMVKSGRTDDPLGALAWVANLAADRGRPLKTTQMVVTGSVITTMPAKPGDVFVFELAGLGESQLTIT
jgi:2-keto-4-pentenoate hydratase